MDVARQVLPRALRQIQTVERENGGRVTIEIQQQFEKRRQCRLATTLATTNANAKGRLLLVARDELVCNLSVAALTRAFKVGRQLERANLLPHSLLQAGRKRFTF